MLYYLPPPLPIFYLGRMWQVHPRLDVEACRAKVTAQSHLQPVSTEAQCHRSPDNLHWYFSQTKKYGV